ncbi:uncharacterized protein LOC106651855 [Trichogramma pretiosum]|uniref:uncharacterized protein LOC106651855 n=1 Tax=Trichogramma pretiosum TaxID=7493 RepID=UPI0006C99D1B|nr:uncharacterized protein LOC106651855 [Trichogramma pretiosum]
MSDPVINPEIPYVGEIHGGVVPGKMVKVQGKVPHEATRFAVNYQLGPGLNPRDDIALHVSPRFPQGIITRNSIESMQWGVEENNGPMWIHPGQPFEIIILCEYYCYKIAVNGRHFAEFTHRLPYDRVTHLVIDGDVEINSIFYETINVGPRPTAPVPDLPTVDVGPPPPGGLYPTLNPQAKFDLPDKDYDPPHPHRQPAAHQKSEDAFGSTLDKVGLAVGGLVAAGGVAAAMHAINKQKKKHDGEADHAKSTSPDYESGLGGLGALGAALASSLASNSHAQQGYPSDSGSGGMIGSLLGALGGGQATAKPNYSQQTSNSDPFGGALGSILGGVLGGGSHQQQPTYQPTGGYPQNQPSQSGGGNDLFGDLKGALLKSAMDDITKHLYPNKPQPSGAENPHPTYHGNMSPPSHDPPNPHRGSGPGKLSAAEISKGLGLSDDEN